MDMEKIRVYDFTFSGEPMCEYARGMISGIMYVMSGKPEKAFAWARAHDEKEWYKTLECTKEQLDEIVETVNHLWPGIIVDVKELETWE